MRETKRSADICPLQAAYPSGAGAVQPVRAERPASRGGTGSSGRRPETVEAAHEGRLRVLFLRMARTHHFFSGGAGVTSRSSFPVPSFSRPGARSQLPGPGRLEHGVGFQTPRLSAAEHLLVLEADLPSPDVEGVIPGGGLSSAARRPELVAQAGRAVDPRLEYDLLARLQVHLNREVDHPHDIGLPLWYRLAVGTRHGRRVFVQVLCDVLELHRFLADVADL